MKSPNKVLTDSELNLEVLGNLGKIFNSEAGVAHEEWTAEYGPTYQYKGFFMGRQVYTADPKATAHIISHPYDKFIKPPALASLQTYLMGKSALRGQPDIMNYG